MKTAPWSGHNELRAEELVTWKVAGRVNGIEREREGERESLPPLERKDT